jgi:hypothetical protein
VTPVTPRQDVIDLCITKAAAAVERYIAASGMPYTAVPEHYVHAAVFDAFPEAMARTLDLTAREIWEFHDAYARRIGRMDAIADGGLPAELNGRLKPDLVLYRDDEPHDRQGPRAVIEFKRYGYESGDLAKIEALLRLMPLLEFGLFVTFCWGDSDADIDFNKRRWLADPAARRWTVQSGNPIRLPPTANRAMFAPLAFILDDGRTG